MKKKSLILFLLLILQIDHLMSQDTFLLSGKPVSIHDCQNQIQLTRSDSVCLMNLPRLEYPSDYIPSDLPPYINNAEFPYFRGILEQVGNECGQIAAIALTFTYEIDRARELPADSPENQYPTHFTYNFGTSGYGWTGVSYFHCFEIIRTNGIPNVADYGGLSFGGNSRWMTGYDKYYNGMHNRIEQVCQIEARTPEGLDILKHWLYDHLEGSETGGMGCFYACSPWNIKTLPEGTPEAGKHVIADWGGPPTHAMAIVGYNDSIRYDYNSDGIYTNDMDINGDGKINMKDWETGGLLFADGYFGGTSFADSGFCYMMYKTLADELEDGGIWNHAIHVAKVKEPYAPLLTMKITLKHTSREKIKVITGVSPDTSLTIPQYTLSFPILNFHGGNQYMQGGNTYEENKTIEFGLDVTPLLSYVDIGVPAKFFLQVMENDPWNQSSGKIIQYSLMDLTSGIQEMSCETCPLQLVNNGMTTVSVKHIPNLNKVRILDESLPVSIIQEPYQHQMTAEGGIPPYKWSKKIPYEQELLLQNFPEINQQKLTPNDLENGFAIQPLEFSFPFYATNYDTVLVHTDGFIMFDDHDYPWPYIYDHALMLRSINTISPLMRQYLMIVPENGDGIWYEGNESYAAFRWKETCEKPLINDVEFAMILYPSGQVEFYYHNEYYLGQVPWAAGISKGDMVNYYIVDVNQLVTAKEELKVVFNPVVYPYELFLSETGLLSGTPENYYQSANMEFIVTDRQNISGYKILPFFSSMYGIQYPGYDPVTVLTQNNPNPFKDITFIEFNLDNSLNVTLEILDIKGRIITTLINSYLNQGSYDICWDGNDSNGNRCPQGIYLYRLRTGSSVFTRKMILVD